MISVGMTMSLSTPASVRGAVCARKAGAGRRRAMMIRTEAAFFRSVYENGDQVGDDYG